MIYDESGPAERTDSKGVIQFFDARVKPPGLAMVKND
jgi:hypothetical protein